MVKRAAIILAAVAGAVTARSLPAQDTSGSRPLLEQLDRETRGLFDEVERGVVRVQVPPPLWLREIVMRENPLNKWGSQLDPIVKQKLEDEARNALAGHYNHVNVDLMPATQPSAAGAFPPGISPANIETSGTPLTTAPTRGTGSSVNVSVHNGNFVVESQSPNGSSVMMFTPVQTPDGRQLMQIKVPTRLVAANNIGLVLDDQGHVLVPLYVEKEAIGETKLPVSTANGQVVMADFVGSDRQTNMTVLKMDKALGHATRFSDGRPTNGAMVMILSPNSGQARMSLWTGGQNEYGVVVGMDGAVAGFVRYGQFLNVRASRPVIEQLIEHGVVKRAALGVKISEVRGDDPIRQQLAALGQHPAMLVHEVVAESPAQRAGLQAEDLILTMGGMEVGDTPSFAIALSAFTGKTQMQIVRGGKIQAIEVELERQ